MFCLLYYAEDGGSIKLSGYNTSQHMPQIKLTVKVPAATHLVDETALIER